MPNERAKVKNGHYQGMINCLSRFKIQKITNSFKNIDLLGSLSAHIRDVRIKIEVKIDL